MRTPTKQFLKRQFTTFLSLAKSKRTKKNRNFSGLYDKRSELCWKGPRSCGHLKQDEPNHLLCLCLFLKYCLSNKSHQSQTNTKSCGQRTVFFFKHHSFKKIAKTCVDRRDVFYYIGRYFQLLVLFCRPLVYIILETADIDRQEFYIKSDTLSILVTTLRKILALQELVSLVDCLFYFTIFTVKRYS